MPTARGRFTVVGGNEESIAEVPDGVRVTRVSGRQRFAGSIEGDGFVDWIFCYLPDRTARFAGLQRIVGTIGTLSGSLVLESTGAHDGRRSTGSWRIVPGSGTGALAGIDGEGTFDAPGGVEVDYTLDYRLKPDPAPGDPSGS
jgi:hypothetical protein